MGLGWFLVAWPAGSGDCSATPQGRIPMIITGPRPCAIVITNGLPGQRWTAASRLA
jgi:hypothetical protein